MAIGRCSGLSNQRHKADCQTVETYDRFGGSRSQRATTGIGLKESFLVKKAMAAPAAQETTKSKNHAWNSNDRFLMSD